MKRLVFWSVPVLLLAATILEALPYGAVLRFATEEETLTYTYSYFSLVPFGYANFAPLITAISTSGALAVSVFCVFKASARGSHGRTALLIVAAATSFAPLLYGRAYFNTVSLIISLILTVALLLSAAHSLMGQKFK